MLNTAFAEVNELEGSLESGACTLRFTPRTEHLRFLLSGRAMGNLRALLPFGENGKSYSYLGLASDRGGLLLSTPIPLTDRALFKVTGDTLRIQSPAPVTL